jgi:Protein of unknown function (DUF4065)
MQGFDAARFEALVLYVAARTQTDEHFGRTKLAKVLFYSDFSVYRDLGESLTGATYMHMPFGPFPKQLEACEERLAAEGRVSLDYGKDRYEEKRIVLKGTGPDLSHFEAWHIVLVDDWIQRIQAATAKQISDLSHKHPGWLIAPHNGDEIPYATALLPQERPNAQQGLEAEAIARERGWLDGDQWIWERESA